MRTEKLEFFRSLMLEASVPNQQQIKTSLLQSQLYKVLNGLQFQLRRLIRYVASKNINAKRKKERTKHKKIRSMRNQG
jgi:predicted transcriptional regulator